MSNEKVEIQRIGDGRIILNNETYCKETSRRVLNHKEYEAYLKMEKENASLKEQKRNQADTAMDIYSENRRLKQALELAKQRCPKYVLNEIENILTNNQ